MTEMAIPQAVPVPSNTAQTLPTELRPTPLAALLAQQATPPELVAYRGALTPARFDAPQAQSSAPQVPPEREAAAIVSGVAVHDLGWLRRIAVRGEDRLRWLSGMVTNTVKELPANCGAWNLVLNAQGRIQGDLHVWNEDGGLFLEIAADQYDRLLAHLDRFIIMDDVELVPVSLDANGELSGETALGLSGPLAAGLLARLGLPAPAEPLTSAGAEWNGRPMRVVRAYGALRAHFELWTKAAEIPVLWRALIEAGAIPVGAAALEAFRIAEAIPAYGIDMAERDLPQETSQMRALSFNKGCYLGQEIVERIRSRGSVHRHLRLLEVFGPVPAAGVELTIEGGAEAGQITSAAELPLPAGRRAFALAMMRAEAEVGDLSFAYAVGPETGTARILAVPPLLVASKGDGESAS